MSPQGSDTHDGGERPDEYGRRDDDEWPDDGRPDHESADDEDPWQGDEDAGVPYGHGWTAEPDGMGGPGGDRRPGGGLPGHRRRPSPVAVAIVAMLAAAIGFGAAFAGSASGPPSPTLRGAALPTFPPAGGSVIPGGPAPAVQVAVAGRVAAVTATSITIEAGGNTLTAAVTSATKVTGRVASVSGIKVGDSVSAEMTGKQGNLTATAIQDPAGPPQ